MTFEAKRGAIQAAVELARMYRDVSWLVADPDGNEIFRKQAAAGEQP